MDAARNENDQVPDVPALLRIIETFALDNARLQGHIDRLTAEKAERDAPVWFPLKVAAHKAGCTYKQGQAFAARAVAAGRFNEARRGGGRVYVNVTALIGQRRLLAGR